jgi:TPR repeat protein
LTGALEGTTATAVRLFRPLAGQGNARAQFNLGVMYYNGQGVPQDYAETLKWFKPSSH